MAVHHITVTGGGPFGRAWFDCSCAAANDAALRHHREVIGCECSRDDFDPTCIQQTTAPEADTRRTA